MGVVVRMSEFFQDPPLLINDRSKFRKLIADPTLTRENKLQGFLRELKNKDKLDNEIYGGIYSHRIATYQSLWTS